ncbi:DUF3892 domain-containing protein [Flavobacterium johnsoniae]|uniref:DUF3892 domain-containing protein n=1 Tax=Flavobacterium TaxID=237 RepID=UPI0015BEA642|nr:MULTISPECIES: DUF3892 domain-containing protein [Flavobacterium]WET04015.1 DUF3892 domain-containing protein [Flavobacterium sp. YJ01]WJS94502.1 DUF3892 domain-containing protein [Flavobacterium johnsoniae]
MAEYRISGIWTDDKGGITHYAVHERIKNRDGKGYTINKAIKKSKAETITLVESKNNTVKTFMWKYKEAMWQGGEDVHVVNGASGKFLRSNHDSTVQDNLRHLIDYSWIY